MFGGLIMVTTTIDCPKCGGTGRIFVPKNQLSLLDRLFPTKGYKFVNKKASDDFDGQYNDCDVCNGSGKTMLELNVQGMGFKKNHPVQVWDAKMCNPNALVYKQADVDLLLSKLTKEIKKWQNMIGSYPVDSAEMWLRTQLGCQKMEE